MTLVRRVLHIAAWIGTVFVALVALALITSQTPWFRDWARRTIVREAKQYLDGELTIGRLGGNLFFGVSLSDVAVDVSGDRVIAVKGLTVDYSVFDLISKGLSIERIVIDAPSVRAVRDAQGWNLRRLVRRQRREAEREGPARPISLPSITIRDGSATIDDRVGSTVYELPRRIDDLDVDAGFEYAPVHYSIELRALNLTGASPDLLLRGLTGGIAVRDDNLYLERVRVTTGETSLAIDGVVEQYLRTPIIKLVTEGNASLPEIARILKPVAGYDLHPAIKVKTAGPLDRLLMDLDVTSEAGLVRGQVTADFKTPDLRFAGGPVHVEHLDLGPIFKTPAQRSDITGDATFDIAILSTPSDAPALDRLDGTFRFSGPRVIAFGYDARKVMASGSIRGPKIALARARAGAYGATATASGVIVLPQGRRAIAYDLTGAADGVDLRLLPRALRVPRLATRLFLSSYHVRGTGSAARGTAAFRTSEIEGATIADGTVAEFELAPGRLAYGARGAVSDLDLRRLGRGLEVAALDKPLYDGRINATFDVKGSGTAIESLDIAATGTLTDSTMAGLHVPEMVFDARIANAALSVTAKGAFDQLNPAVLSGRDEVNGNVNGRVDGTFTIPDLGAELTPAAFGFDGRVTLDPSLVGGVQIAAADVQGTYAREVADITRLQIKGPDVIVDASGRLALDRSSSSSLTYHVDATNLTEIGRITGQALEGSAILDGSIEGNAEALQTRGTLRGLGLKWKGNTVLSVESAYDVVAPDLDFVNAKVQATTRATFVEAAGVQLSEITASTTYAQKRLEFDTKVQERTRQLDAKGSVVFHPDHQEIHLPQFAVRTEGIEWRSVPGGDPAIQYGRDEVVLKDVKLASGDQTLDLEGTLPMRDGQASGTLEVRARNVDLTQVERLLLQNRGLAGRLTADATITGSSSRPIVDGHVEVVDGAFQGYRYQSLAADVDYAGNRLTLDATLQQAPGVTITAKGVVPTTLFERSKGEHVAAAGEDSIDLRIRTSGLNLGVVQGFTTQVSNVQGSLEADVRVVGSGRDPHLDGFVEIRDGAFAVPRGGTSYSGLDTRIDLTPDAVRIRRFEILDENGEQLAVSGQLAVHERRVGAVDVSLESQNFEIIDNELGDVGVGSRLRVSGELLRPRIDGDIRVAAGRLEVDRLLQLFYDPYRTEELPNVVSAEAAAQAAGSAREATQGALAQAATRGAGAPGAAEAPADAKAKAEPAPAGGAFENLALDVRLRIPDNLVLRGRKLRPGGPTRASIGDINITVGGDLEIKKDAGGTLSVAGVVTMVRGTYTFQGRQFDIARGGTLRFAGEPDNPILDITATRAIPDTGVEARVRITGSVSTPELHLTSTPPLDESDVLALIVFNRPINELGTGERTSLAATAGGIATGFIATPLGESIGKALDLDLFEITTNAEGDSLGAGVTVGEQIGDRTFLKLRQQFGDRTYTEFLLEYQIRDFLRVVGAAAPETSGAGNRIGQHRIERAGLDVIFFFSY